MLTKSLHTITAATNVARLLARRPHTNPDTLASAALAVLGYEVNCTDSADPTVQRIVENCAKLLAAQVKVAA